VSNLTMEFKGVQEEVIKNAIKKGYAKTKAEVVRMALVDFGRQMDLIRPKLHARAEAYAYVESKAK